MRKTLTGLLALALFIGLLGTGAAVASEAAEPITITYWMPLAADKVAPIFTTNADMDLWKEMEARTGVHVEWLHPPVGQENENRNLMLASDQLPDVIQWDFAGYPGGALKAIDDGIILKLNDLIDSYATNLTTFLENNPIFRKDYALDDGTYYGFPFLRSHPMLLVWRGPVVRDDFVEAAGLDLPVTIDDWTEMLRAFKADGITYPFSMAGLNELWGQELAGAFEASSEYFLTKEGTVAYGPIQDGFKDYLTMMNTWFTEGLLDPDFATQDLATLRSKILNGEVGAFMGNMGGGIGYLYNTIGKTTDPSIDFSLAGVGQPVLEEGQKSRFGQYDNYMTSMQASVSADVDEAILPRLIEWLDYGYGYDGYILFNFGVEGKSFTWDDTTPTVTTVFDLPAYPRYMDCITNNPDLAITLAASNWINMHFGGVGVQAPEYLQQFNDNEDQMGAMYTWMESSDFSAKMPRISYTTEEADLRAAYQSQLDTYRDEWIIKFITGTEPLDKFDDFVSGCKQLHAEELTAAAQAAVDRYNAR